MKNKLTTMVALAAILGFSATLRAVPITGSMSFNGDETAYSGVNGTGSIIGNLSAAQSIVFNDTQVSGAPAPNGSFTGLGGQTVTMTPFLNINPAQLPGGPVWSVGGFTMTLSTLATISSGLNSLVLGGVGVISDGIAADNSIGIWTATFTSGISDNSVTFSWNSSTGVPRVPDGGTTVLLLGAALSGLGLLRKKMLA